MRRTRILSNIVLGLLLALTVGLPTVALPALATSEQVSCTGNYTIWNPPFGGGVYSGLAKCGQNAQIVKWANGRVDYVVVGSDWAVYDGVSTFDPNTGIPIYVFPWKHLAGGYASSRGGGIGFNATLWSTSPAGYKPIAGYWRVYGTDSAFWCLQATQIGPAASVWHHCLPNET